jgi:hypothetical protein
MLQEQVPCRVQLECAWSNIEVQARKRFHEGFSRDMTKAISAKTQDLSRLRTGFEDAFGLWSMVAINIHLKRSPLHPLPPPTINPLDNSDGQEGPRRHSNPRASWPSPCHLRRGARFCSRVGHPSGSERGCSCIPPKEVRSQPNQTSCQTERSSEKISPSNGLFCRREPYADLLTENLLPLSFSHGKCSGSRSPTR